MLKDIFVGEDTPAYEDTSGADPETVTDTVDKLLIEKPTTTEEPEEETINTAMVIPPEKDEQETEAEVVYYEEDEPAETVPWEEAMKNITDPLTICGGAFQEKAFEIYLGVPYTNAGLPIATEEWYKFKTSPNQSVYIISGKNDGSMWPVDFTIYTDDMTEIAVDTLYTGNTTTGLVLSPDTEYWMYIENGRACIYTFSITEQILDGGMTRTEAYPIELNTSYDKVIEIPGLPDWYKFVTTDNQSVYRFSIDKKISESVISGFVYLTIYDSDGIKVTEYTHRLYDDQIGYIDIYLNPNTEYYLKINGENDQYSIGDYRFSISEQICDAGTSRNSALVLEYGERHTGQINSTLSDWYQIEIPVTGKYVFKLHNIDTGADVKCLIYLNSSDSNLFSSTASNEDSSSRSFSLNQGDILYLRIFSESFAANGTYIFEILPEE